MKIKKKTVSQLIGLAVLLGAVEVTHQLTKTEEQVTYSVTLENLALGNGETDGETGGTGEGGADGETGGGNNNEPIREGTYIHYWHPKSKVNSIWAKITPSQPLSQSSTISSYSGNISIRGKSIGIGGNTSSTYRYQLQATHFECKFSWLSPRCPQKEEHTLYNYNLIE